MLETFSILRNGEYRKYAAATFLSCIGNGMYFVAMSWYLYKLTDKASSIGWILIMSSLPGLLFSPWIGVLVDRWSLRWICIGTDILRGAILLGVAAGMQAGVLEPAHIFAATFLLSLCANFFQPASGALVRNIAAKDRLLKANIVSNMTMQVGMLGGASLGGLMVAGAGAAWVVFVNALSFFVSGWLIGAIARTADDGAGQSRKKAGFAEELRATRDYVGSHPAIVWLAIQQMLVYVTLYVCNTLLPVFVDRELKASVSAFGLIDAAWGEGALAGGLCLTYIVSRIPGRHFGIVGLGSLSAALLVFLTANNVAQALVAYFFLGFCACIIRVNTDTIIAAEVDPAFFGKIKATISMFTAYGGLLVYSFVGYAGDKVSVRSIYLAVCILIALTALAATIRSRRPAPTPLS